MVAMEQTEVIDELNRAREVVVGPSTLSESLITGDRDGGEAGLGLGEFPAIGPALLQDGDRGVGDFEGGIRECFDEGWISRIVMNRGWLKTLSAAWWDEYGTKTAEGIGRIRQADTVFSHPRFITILLIHPSSKYSRIPA